MINEHVLGERRLLFAVLERAILDVVGYKLHPRMERTDEDNENRDGAWQWMYSTNTDPWSFWWVCTHLNICPMRTIGAVEMFDEQGVTLRKTLKGDCEIIEDLAGLAEMGIDELFELNKREIEES